MVGEPQFTIVMALMGHKNLDFGSNVPGSFFRKTGKTIFVGRTGDKIYHKSYLNLSKYRSKELGVVGCVLSSKSFITTSPVNTSAVISYTEIKLTKKHIMR